MRTEYLKITAFCLLISIPSFSQNETEGIVEKKDQPAQQTQIENIQQPKETSNDSTIESTETPNTDELSSTKHEEATPQTESDAQTPVTSSTEQKNMDSAQPSAKSDFTNVNQLLKEVRLMREQTEKLLEKADKFEDDAEDIDDDIDDLEDLADDLEDEAAKLLKQAGELQACIKTVGDSRDVLRMDTSVSMADTGDTVSSEGEMKDHKALMLKMRKSADQLLTKAKEIAVQVREMKEASEEKEELSDTFEDQATALEDKAEELEEIADSLEEQQDLLPLAKRYPVRLGHQIRFSAVPPFNDRHAHILLISGIHVSWYLKNFISIGCEDMSLRFHETIYGTRIAICGSPAISYSFFPLKKLELGFGIGTAIQGQVGADRKYALAAAPFLKVFNETWVAKRFSLGPVMKINYGAANDFFTRVVPSDNAGILPQKAWWMDFGITYTFHF